MLAEHLDLGRVAHGVDHVIAVQGETVHQPLSQGARALGAAHGVAGLDHALASLFHSLALELFADHVRKRERVEAARLEKADDFALAGAVQT